MSTSYLPRLHAETRMQLFDGSSGTTETYLICSPRGQYWTVPDSYYKFFLCLDGTKTLDDLQNELDSGDYGILTGCSASDVVDRFIRPNGLLDEELPASAASTGQKTALRATFVFPLFHSGLLSPLTRFTQSAFRPSVVALVLTLGSLLLLNTYYNLQTFFTQYGMMQELTWRMMFVVLLSFPLHELGHISACRRYHVSAGSIGLGLYMFLPVMYADLSGIWVLPRRHRLAVNLGGVYFEFIGACVLALIAAETKNAEYAIASFLFLASCLINLNPFIKMDGYWCTSDLLGVPNLIRNSFKAWKEWLSGKRERTGSKLQQPVLMVFFALCILAWLLGAWASWRLIVAAYKALWLIRTIGFCPRKLWWQFSPADLQNILLIGFVAIFLLSFAFNLISFLRSRRVVSVDSTARKDFLTVPR
jgi:hypothetical protein